MLLSSMSYDRFSELSSLSSSTDSFEDFLCSMIVQYNSHVTSIASLSSSSPVAEEPDLAEAMSGDVCFSDNSTVVDVHEFDDSKFYFDTVSGSKLNKSLVLDAMREEVQYMQRLPVWDLNQSWESVAAATADLGKIDASVYSKWVLTNKKDDRNPDIRALLVACEVKGKSPSLQEYFSATPPLEALRIMVALASQNRLLHFNFSDVRKAHLNGHAKRTVIVKLQNEVSREQGGRWVLLLRSLYGCRDAAACWEAEIEVVFLNLGFTRGRCSPALWFHKERDIRCLIHGDDVVTLALPSQLAWCREQVAKAWLMSERGVLGPDERSRTCTSIRILNRIISVTSSGYEWEADSRHVDILTRGLSRPVSTPGTKSDLPKGDVSGWSGGGVLDVRKVGSVEGREWSSSLDSTKTGGVVDAKGVDDGEDALLSADDAYLYRSLVMRGAYLSLDRVDIAYSVKELARAMSAPRRSDVARFKRLGRYLLQAGRVVVRYDWSRRSLVLTCECDADFASCRVSRKSTSGLFVCWGTSFVKFSSKTQTTIALSTQESEFYSIVSCVATGLGLQQLFLDFGVNVSVAVHSDASAGISLALRKGLGKAKHVCVQWLWVQQVFASELARLYKVGTLKNRSDLATKFLEAKRIQYLLSLMGMEFRAGRHDLALDTTG